MFDTPGLQKQWFWWVFNAFLNICLIFSKIIFFILAYFVICQKLRGFRIWYSFLWFMGYLRSCFAFYFIFYKNLVWGHSQGLLIFVYVLVMLYSCVRLFASAACARPSAPCATHGHLNGFSWMVTIHGSYESPWMVM